MRCPSCTDLSVAQSNTSTAIAVRHQIESMVAEGRSTAAIDQALVSEYGQAILLVPPDAGGVPVIWIVPLVLGVAVLAGVGVLFWRRSRAFEALRRGGSSALRARRGRAGAMKVDDPVDRRPRPRDERWHLADEREFLRRSLDDAAREHEAGDLSDEDHAVLVARDSARLAEVEVELAALAADPAPTPLTQPPGTPPLRRAPPPSPTRRPAR